MNIFLYSYISRPDPIHTLFFHQLQAWRLALSRTKQKREHSCQEHQEHPDQDTEPAAARSKYFCPYIATLFCYPCLGGWSRSRFRPANAGS